MRFIKCDEHEYFLKILLIDRDQLNGRDQNNVMIFMPLKILLSCSYQMEAINDEKRLQEEAQMLVSRTKRKMSPYLSAKRVDLEKHFHRIKCQTSLMNEH